MKTLVYLRSRLILFLLPVLLSLTGFLFVTPPVSADGLIYVECPPIVLPPSGGTPVPFPIPRIDINPTTTAPGAPPFITPIPPRPPVRRDCATYLSVKNHNVTVAIDNLIAKTHVDETFVNDSTYSLEGTYIFPLPDDATISEFAMWMDGKRVEGRVLDKNDARRIYEDIVRRQRDPALLEYVGRNAFQARIFPIPPKTEKRVEIEYAQVLRADHGLVRYVYPLNTEKFSPQPLANVSVNVSIKSNAALKAIYSPSHNVGLARNGDYQAKVGYEDSNVRPDRDFVLYYSMAQEEIGLNLVSYKALGSATGAGEDGFFVMLVTPKVQVDRSQVVAKDVILVLDVSGSMQGSKIAQAKNALTYILNQLNQPDRFNIITFSTSTNAYASSLRPVSARDDARNFVSRIVAEGSTDINRALLEAVGMADKERPTTIIFLTDGLPTTGETNSQRIIANVTNAASLSRNVRLFAFGVGDDVNTILLDTLSDKLHGASAYVRPAEKIDEVVSAFYAKISTPVLSAITINWGGMVVNDVYPYPLPDLFAGTQLVVAGRYRGSGTASVTLSGSVNGIAQSFKYSDVTFRASGGDDWVPRLWATRKIGYLLSEIRLRGETKEAVAEIVALAIRYGIVTPYTSFLVDERQDVLTQAGRTDAARKLAETVAPAAMPTSGARAVQQSQDQSLMRGANVPPTLPTSVPKLALPGSPEGAPGQREPASIQTVGDKTFVFRNGVWTDTQFDPSKGVPTKVEFGSEAYFTLVSSSTDLGRYLALGPRVIVVYSGKPYEIVDSGTGATTAGVLPVATLTPAPKGTPQAAPNLAPPANNSVAAVDSGLYLLGAGMVVLVGAFGVGMIVAASRGWFSR